MRTVAVATALGVALAGALLAHTVLGQNAPAPGPSQPHHHESMPSHGTGMPAQPMPAAREMAAGAPALPGQDAFAAIADIVKILDADPRTDWARVDLERLRQHLIDMNEVVLRSAVRQAPVPGGLAMEIPVAGHPH